VIRQSLRIAFVPMDIGGCFYYRCWVPGQELRRRGHQVHFVRQLNDPAVAHAHVVVFQRQGTPGGLRLLRDVKARGIAVLHEFDDNFHELPPSNPFAVYFDGTPLTRVLEQVCLEADGLLLSTRELADEYLRYNPRTFVCYNAIDDAYFWRLAPQRITGRAKRDGQIRLGYAGSSTHSGDFATIVPALVRVLTAFPQTKLVFIGQNQRDQIPEQLWDQTEFLGGTGTDGDLRYDDIRMDSKTEAGLASVRYYEAVRQADFDIGLAPLMPVTFNRCKSYLKVAEYGALGIPAIASRLGPYMQYQNESREPVVALADSLPEWEAALSALVESQTRRATLAVANLSYVHRAHLISRRIRAWEDSFEAVLIETANERLNAKQIPANYLNTTADPPSSTT
jgi:glycosyltransferase involved in cell wall biosynthesis